MRVNHLYKTVDCNIEIISRAFILVANQVLLCRARGKDWFFLPGGHTKFGESIEKSLLREIREELGISIKNLSFIGVVENMYVENRQKHHEINLVFSTRIKKIKPQSKENHIEFILKDLRLLVREKVLPKNLKDAIIEWLRNKRMFWKGWGE